MSITASLAVLALRAAPSASAACTPTGDSGKGIYKPSPSISFIPGVDSLHSVLDTTEGLVIAVIVFTLFVSAGLLGLHMTRGDGERVGYAKAGIVGAFAGAVLVGAAYAFIVFAVNKGSAIC